MATATMTIRVGTRVMAITAITGSMEIATIITITDTMETATGAATTITAATIAATTKMRFAIGTEIVTITMACRPD